MDRIKVSGTPKKTSKGNMNIKFHPGVSQKIREMSKQQDKPITQIVNELCYASLALGELDDSGISEAKATIMPGKAMIQIPVATVVDICFNPSKITGLFPLIKKAYSDYLKSRYAV